MNHSHREHLVVKLDSTNLDEQRLARNELYREELDDELAEKLMFEFETPEERAAAHGELATYRAAGSPYGNTWGDFRHWSADQDPDIDQEESQDDSREVDRVVERDAAAAADQANEKMANEAVARATDEGMNDLVEEAQMTADSDESKDT